MSGATPSALTRQAPVRPFTVDCGSNDRGGVTVYGYSRVSTDEQASSGLGLAAQRTIMEQAAIGRGWSVEWATDAGVSGSVSMADRDALGPVLGGIARGDVLVVAKLDRLSRSLADFAALMDRSARECWDLVALDLGVDTTTPTGRFVANLMANVSQLERELIGQRTRDALAERKRQGTRLGGPVTMAEDVRSRIAGEHAAGETLSAIARRLTAEGVPTARGGARWYPSTVRAVVHSVALDAEAAIARKAAA